MKRTHHALAAISLTFSLLFITHAAHSQDLPPRYATLELFTNTPCPICGTQNPGLFNRLQAFEGQYHLISFYPGKPYTSCIFYQDNISENTTRWQFYSGNLFGTPTVAINGLDFKNSSGVTNAVLNDITGNDSWLEVNVDETAGTNRTVDITMEDHVGGSLTTGRLFAVIVEKEIAYNAPNGETLHHNVFRKFLSPATGEDVNLSSGQAIKNYTYTVDNDWDANQTYVIAWVSNPATKDIYNSGTRFDPDFLSATHNPANYVGEVKIYPNPSRDQVFVDLPSLLNQTVKVKIISPSGQLIKNLPEQHVTSAPLSISIQDLVSGVYYILLEGKEKSYRGKVVVE